MSLLRNSVLLHSRVIGVSLLVVATATPQGQYCPQVCAALEYTATSGQIPPGVYLAVNEAAPQNGEGSAFCQTCKNCKQYFDYAFNGYGGSWCVSKDTGAGWSTPIGVDARPGWLRTNCNAAPTWFSIRILDCTTGTVAYQRDDSLECYCVPVPPP